MAASSAVYGSVLSSDSHVYGRQAGAGECRLEGGAMKHPEHAIQEDMGGIQSFLTWMLALVLSLRRMVLAICSPPATVAIEAEWQWFLTKIWPKISNKEDKQSSSASMVWQEICPILKGSSEATNTPTGYLKLDAYLEVGHKRAPNFTAETRRKVHALFLKYEQKKRRLNSLTDTTWGRHIASWSSCVARYPSACYRDS
ncbi:hypothetical protein ABBQ38_011374 [Trebouxia sp. C0009 RCD-2024]